jgi:hypothetical protein
MPQRSLDIDDLRKYYPSFFSEADIERLKAGMRPEALKRQREQKNALRHQQLQHRPGNP